jgi:hypothetical protein
MSQMLEGSGSESGKGNSAGIRSFLAQLLPGLRELRIWLEKTSAKKVAIVCAAFSLIALGIIGAVVTLLLEWPEARTAVLQFIHIRKSEEGSRVNSAGDFKVDKGGEWVQLGFWTPSAQTQNDLKDQDGNIAAEDKWQIVQEADIDKFGNILHGFSALVPGFRRYEVAGQGKRRFKHGWWWEVTISKMVTPQQIAETYFQFFKPPAGYDLYMEVLDSHGNYVSNAIKK